jgi:para-nitrobenzyl esterase
MRNLTASTTLAILVTLGLAGCGGNDSPAPTPSDPTLVQTQQGAVKGAAASGVETFLGIPYAAPPIGALRWKPPTPPAARTTTLDASKPGNECVQAGATPTSPPAGNEDCLYLNIYRPVTRASAALPVVFAIHGGGFALGSALFVDGTALAENNGVIVVSVNYRLNALGFLAHPALSAEDATTHASGNYGLMDQNAALVWVKQNISSFGGDPANVTITGGSAGGYSVFSHLASPMSAGLFAKAVPQSGGFTRIQAPLAQAEAAGVTFAAPWSCNGRASNADIAACLRALPASTTMAGALSAPQTGTGNLSSWLPDVDGKFLTTSTSTAFAAGTFNKVPVLAGFVDDEGTFFVSAAFGQNPITDSTYQPVGIQGFLGFSDPAVAGQIATTLYPTSTYPSPNQALARVYGDYRVICGVMQDSEAIAAALPAPQKAYLYQFSEKNPYTDASSLANLLPPNNNITYGAFHGADLNYWFDQFANTPTAQQSQLAQSMAGALAAFAKTGDPNAPGAFPQWTPYSAAQRSVMSLSHTEANAAFDAYDSHQCNFWYGQAPSTHL